MNIFKNAYFGKSYRTRDGRKALYIRKDDSNLNFVHHDLETQESYNPVRIDGTDLYTKEGFESNNDIISEWEEINGEKF